MSKYLRVLSIVLVLIAVFSSCGENNAINSEEISATSEFSIVDEEVSVDVLVSNEESSEEISYDENEFYILYTEGEVDFSKAPKAEIGYYPWNDDYKPYAYGQVIFKKGDGFYIRMYCQESNPKAEIKEIGGNVYQDSALEFFCDYRPETKKRKTHYINLEMNSKGVYLANFGNHPVSLFYKPTLDVKGQIYKDYWTVTAHIPLEMLYSIYGKYDIGKGSIVECNFTKCGSGTEIKHWGTWQLLSGNTPNFHQPKRFGKVVIR